MDGVALVWVWLLAMFVVLNWNVSNLSHAHMTADFCVDA